MAKINEKIQASILFASYFETIGFHNGKWEFNYQYNITNLNSYCRVWNKLLHNYIILGGSNIDVTGMNASDDTILIIATAEAVIKGGGMENYKQSYIDSYDMLIDMRRASGITTIKTLDTQRKGSTIKINPLMGGNGAALRTGIIGLIYYNDVEKVINESIMASRITHNFYIGFLSGMVTALFTSFAMKNIPPWEWIDRMITLYDNKTIEKYYPSDHKLSDMDGYMGQWKRYKETRLNKLKYKNTLDTFIYPEERTEFLISFNMDSEIKELVS